MLYFFVNLKPHINIKGYPNKEIKNSILINIVKLDKKYMIENNIDNSLFKF